MQLILREDVPQLGKVGDVVKVADGYGRNYLLPQKKAVVATDTALKFLEQEREVLEARREKRRLEAEGFAQKVAELKVSIERQAGEEDRIFGSVSTREIAQYLGKEGMDVDKRLIRIKEPIRTVGEHVVEVHLHSDVVALLKVNVVKK